MNLPLTVASFCLLVASAAYTDADPDLRLDVRYDPNPVRAELRVDSESQSRTYRWVFVTDVRNESPVPLRVVRFGVRTKFGDEWSSLEDLSFGTKEFTEWYTDGDPVDDGWIRPRQAARDAANWIRGNSPMSERSKWVYVAEDEAGNQVIGEREIERVPYVEVDPDWGVFNPDQLVSIAGEIDYDAQGNPDYAQIRLRRFENTALPHEIVELEKATNFSIRVAPAGLFQLVFYAPGYERLSLPILLDEDDPGLGLTIHPTPHDLDARPEGVYEFDSDHNYLQTVVKLDREAKESELAFSRAYRAHMKKHASLDDFNFDRGRLTNRLEAAMSESEPLPVRQFAAWTLSGTPAGFEAPAAERILEVLPPESTIWATDPSRATQFAMNAGRSLGQDLMQDFLEKSPDRGVQGSVLISQALEARNRSRYDEVLILYERLSTGYADLPRVRAWLPRLVQSDAIRPGKTVPSFEFESIDDDSVITDESLRGRAYLLHFWASWCGPCRVEMPEVEAVQTEFGGDDFTVVSLSLDRKLTALRSYRRQKHPMRWPNGWLAGGSESEVARSFDVLGIPFLVLVNENGTIVEAGGSLRGEKLHEKVAQLLGDG